MVAWAKAVVDVAEDRRAEAVSARQRPVAAGASPRPRAGRGHRCSRTATPVLFEGAVFPGHTVTDRDILASSSRSQSSACGQVLRIASRPASAMTRGPSIVFA